MAASKKIVTLQDFTEEMYSSNSTVGLSSLLALVKRGEPWRIPLERLIRLNGNSRRGKIVNQQINDQLRQRGLVCTPAIENADYYGDVVVSDPRDELPRVETVASLPISAFRSELPQLVACGPEMSAVKVRTIMIRYDISQMPVLSHDRKNLYGVVTWRSIAQFGGEMDAAKAADVMGNHGHVASSADDFLELVETIIEQEYVLYRAPNGCVDGIVTASDLAQAFNDTAGVFIQLQEVESRLRILLDRSSIPSLRAHLDPKRRDRKNFRGASDMTFGEYLSALRNPEIWAATGVHLDQEICLKLFDRVRGVRNDVMHFSPGRDDKTDSQREYEAAVTQSLRVLRAIPVRPSLAVLTV